MALLQGDSFLSFNNYIVSYFLDKLYKDFRSCLERQSGVYE